MENQIFTNPTKASSKPLGSVGTYLGKVVRIADNGDLFVKIPHLSTKRVFGPCKNFAGHAPVDIYVIVSFLDSRLDEPVVTGVETSVRYKVGDTGPGGGIIFYVDRFGEYTVLDFGYLEVSASHADTSRTWAQASKQTSSVSGAFGKGLGRGYQNTIDIVEQGNTSAATCAATYCSEFADQGISDWYLPSLGELGLLRTSIQLGLDEGSFWNAQYWSSTQYTNANAYTQDFITGTVTTPSKAMNLRTRPIRRFK